MTAFHLDILIGGVIVLGALWGLRSGGIRLAGPFLLLAGFIILRESYPEIIDAFRNQPKLPTMMLVKLGLLGVLMLYGLLARYIHRAAHASGLGPINRVAGLVLGSVTAVIVSGFGVWISRTFAAADVDVLLPDSRLGPAVLQIFALLTLIAEHLV